MAANAVRRSDQHLSGAAARVIITHRLDYLTMYPFDYGCTCVSEMYWPTKYFPPCLRHDFDWQTGNGGWEANTRSETFKMERATGFEPATICLEGRDSTN